MAMLTYLSANNFINFFVAFEGDTNLLFNRPLDRNNSNGPKVHGVIGIKEHKKQYDLPFNQKNLKMLYDMRPSPEPSSVSLSIMRVGYDGNRIDIEQKAWEKQKYHRHHKFNLTFSIGRDCPLLIKPC